MLKIVVLVAAAAVACRLLTGKWPWELWRASQISQDEAQARALLGLHRGASREDIIDAHRRRLTQVHPDRGGSSEAVHKANHARDVLLARLADNRSETS